MPKVYTYGKKNIEQIEKNAAAKKRAENDRRKASISFGPQSEKNLPNPKRFSISSLFGFGGSRRKQRKSRKQQKKRNSRKQRK